MATRVLLDINCVLELILNRKKSKLIQNYITTYLDCTYCIAASSIPTIWYFVEKDNTKKNEYIDFLSSFVIFDTQVADIDLAYKLWKGVEFEDALQIATTLNHNCDHLITLDKQLNTVYHKDCKIVLL